MSVSTTAHFSLSSWSAMRDQEELDASGIEFLVAAFEMAGASLLIAMLPVSQRVGGSLQPGSASGRGERQAGDQGVGRGVDLGQCHLRIFPPAAAEFRERGTSG